MIIKITPIKFNNKRISFTENNLNNLTPNDAILSLQNPNAKVKFEKDLKLTQRADAVQSDPASALGYKLYKTFKFIFNPETDTPKSQGSIKQENLSLIA